MQKYTKYFILSFFVVLGIVLIIIGSSYSLFNYQVKGKTKNKIVTGIYSSCEYENGTEWTFDYTGSEQTFTVPCDGEYKVELWGAQGGNNDEIDLSYYSAALEGGKGAYTTGDIYLEANETMYIYVGSSGVTATDIPGSVYTFNGGGFINESWNKPDYATGGGATDIRLNSGDWNDFDSLKTRIMVAAGGGGAGNRGIDKNDSGYYYGGSTGGAGGTLTSQEANNFISNPLNKENYGYSYGSGASQTASGGATVVNGTILNSNPSFPFNKNSGFGIGDSYSSNNVISSTGGGGYYGGGGGRHAGGSGGSSFISGYEGCNAIAENSTAANIVHTGQSIHYSGLKFENANMIDGAGYNWTNEKGEYVGMPTHDGTTTMTGNSGNGYAKITLVKSHERYKESILNGTDPVLDGSLIPVQIADNGTVTKANIYDKWYSYENKEWANAVILKDESISYQNGETIPEANIESYFVWIPRYKYKIFDEGNYTGLTSISSKEKTIEVIFENKDTTPSNGTTVGDYLTHPAFTSFDSNGFWVGKFETGYDGATTRAAAQVNSVATDKIIIKPNTYSWRNITVGNMFKNSYDYLRSLDSHMMKNTEWGAVAYLQHSSYGSRASVRINNNSAYITGYSATVEPTLGHNAGTSIEGNRVESTSIGVDGTYTVNYLNTSSNVSSTTGNYTGIYDISGGAWEYVMGYTTGASTVGGSSGITSLYANFFSDTIYTKYWNKYTSTVNTNYNNRILGDATGEMGPFGRGVDPDNNTRYKSSWYKDHAYFADASNPWFIRGGNWYYGAGAGDFVFERSTGGTGTDIGYRIVLTPQ